MSAILSARGLGKIYPCGDGGVLEILTEVDFDIAPGEFVAIIGESGAGKSTLLHLLGALDRPTSGTVRLEETEFSTASARTLDGVRSRHLGFVFQFHHLLRDFSALENVMMPLRILGTEPDVARDRATALLRQFGLGARLSHRPTQLSGGEQQRVAVARALANQPRVVLADEPSGNLDQAQAERLHDLFGSLARDFQTALVVVTHNRQLASRADRTLVMEGGRLLPTPLPQEFA